MLALVCRGSLFAEALLCVQCYSVVCGVILGLWTIFKCSALLGVGSCYWPVGATCSLGCVYQSPCVWAFWLVQRQQLSGVLISEQRLSSSLADRSVSAQVARAVTCTLLAVSYLGLAFVGFLFLCGSNQQVLVARV